MSRRFRGNDQSDGRGTIFLSLVSHRLSSSRQRLRVPVINGYHFSERIRDISVSGQNDTEFFQMMTSDNLTPPLPLYMSHYQGLPYFVYKYLYRFPLIIFVVFSLYFLVVRQIRGHMAGFHPPSHYYVSSFLSPRHFSYFFPRRLALIFAYVCMLCALSS